MRHDAWFLSSKLSVDSKNVRRHLDWVLDQLGGRRVALRDLAERGAKLDVNCYWVSASGHGGPMLSPPQLTKLADLEIELQFDVYFAGRAS